MEKQTMEDEIAKRVTDNILEITHSSQLNFIEQMKVKVYELKDELTYKEEEIGKMQKEIFELQSQRDNYKQALETLLNSIHMGNLGR